MYDKKNFSMHSILKVKFDKIDKKIKSIRKNIVNLENGSSRKSRKSSKNRSKEQIILDEKQEFDRKEKYIEEWRCKLDELKKIRSNPSKEMLKHAKKLSFSRKRKCKMTVIEMKICNYIKFNLIKKIKITDVAKQDLPSCSQIFIIKEISTFFNNLVIKSPKNKINKLILSVCQSMYSKFFKKLPENIVKKYNIPSKYKIQSNYAKNNSNSKIVKTKKKKIKKTNKKYGEIVIIKDRLSKMKKGNHATVIGENKTQYLLSNSLRVPKLPENKSGPGKGWNWVRQIIKDIKKNKKIKNAKAKKEVKKEIRNRLKGI